MDGDNLSGHGKEDDKIAAARTFQASIDWQPWESSALRHKSGRADDEVNIVHRNERNQGRSGR